MNDDLSLPELHDLVGMLHLRIAQQEREAAALHRVADFMKERGYQDSHELVEALNRGEIVLSDEEIETLISAGVMAPDTE